MRRRLLSEQLRHLYQAYAEAPLPEQFSNLLQKLESADAGIGAAPPPPTETAQRNG